MRAASSQCSFARPLGELCITAAACSLSSWYSLSKGRPEGWGRSYISSAWEWSAHQHLNQKSSGVNRMTRATGICRGQPSWEAAGQGGCQPSGFGPDCPKVQDEGCCRWVCCQGKAPWAAQGGDSLAGESCTGTECGAPACAGLQGNSSAEMGFLSRYLTTSFTQACPK